MEPDSAQSALDSVKPAAETTKTTRVEKAGADVFYPTRSQIDEHKKAMSPVWKKLDDFVGASGKTFSDVISK